MSLKISDLAALNTVTVGATGFTPKLLVEGSNSGGLAEIYVSAGSGNAFRLNTNFVNGNYIDINPYITGVSNGGFSISQSGTPRFVITAAGNVGINTTTDVGAKLSVVGNIYNNGDFRIGASYGATNTGIIKSNSGVLSLFTWGDSTNIQIGGNDVIFKPEAGTERMRITSTGNVGIGTPTPARKLTIESASTTWDSAPSIAFYDSVVTANARNWVVGNVATDYGSFNIASSTTQGGVPTTPRLTINKDGNVGVGVSAPKNKLTVNGVLSTKPDGVDAYYSYLRSNWTADNAFELGISDNGVTTFHKLITSSNYYNGSTLQFWTNDTERGRFDISGNLGIGTQNPRTKLEVEAYTSFMSLSSTINSEATTANQQIGGIDFRKHYALAIGASIRLLQAGGPNNYSTSHLAFYTNDGGTAFNTVPPEKVRITSNGNLLINTQTDSGYKLSVVGDSLFSGYSKSYTGNVNSDNYFEKVFSDAIVFTNGVANSAADVRLGNLSFWGYIEVEVTATYSNQNSAGKLTKVFAVGTNPNNQVYTNESRIVDAMGTIPDNIAIGDMSWDGTNTTYRIPISHIASSGNNYTVKVRMFTHSSGAWTVFNAISIGAKYTLTALPRQYPYYNDRLGIGAVEPTAKLDLRGDLRVSGNGVNDGGLIGFGNYIQGTGYYDNAIYRSAFSSPGTPGNALHISSYEALVFTSQAASIGSQAVRLFINGANGNIVIGGITDAGYKLDVTGNTRINSTSASLTLYSSTYGRTGVIGLTDGGANLYVTSPSAGNLYLGNNTTTFVVGSLSVSGTATATGFFNSSDIRLKEIVDYDYSVSDIKPISYLWKDLRDNKKHIGYSAQDVQKVMPDAVNEDADGMLSVNYIEVLVAKIAELENRIKQLEK